MDLFLLNTSTGNSRLLKPWFCHVLFVFPAVLGYLLLIIQDVGFVMDNMCAVLSGMEDAVVNVRVKATWSAGNVSDALVHNK